MIQNGTNMGRIWLKTRFDSEMNMDIPHSFNIANAMYGFRELGAEIFPYHSLDDIYDKVDREDIVLDYIDQCNEIFRKFGVEPHIPDYPDRMKCFLGRKIWIFVIRKMAEPYWLNLMMLMHLGITVYRVLHMQN